MKLEDYRKYYIQGSDHYLIPKDEFEELLDEMQNWKEENEKQEEIIEKAIEYVKTVEILNILEVHRGYEEEYTNPLLEILEDKGD